MSEIKLNVLSIVDKWLTFFFDNFIFLFIISFLIVIIIEFINKYR